MVLYLFCSYNFSDKEKDINLNNKKNNSNIQIIIALFSGYIIGFLVNHLFFNKKTTNFDNLINQIKEIDNNKIISNICTELTNINDKINDLLLNFNTAKNRYNLDTKEIEQSIIKFQTIINNLNTKLLDTTKSITLLQTLLSESKQNKEKIEELNIINTKLTEELNIINTQLIEELNNNIIKNKKVEFQNSRYTKLQDDYNKLQDNHKELQNNHQELLLIIETLKNNSTNKDLLNISFNNILQRLTQLKSKLTNTEKQEIKNLIV